ncbi:hypothetical protein AB0D57_27805 [Streptomyces sp. NPDC048275]|uniref:hypothetical protein n=1 Tax=Streptomyces sp. NPDC048275 TaxID=3155629 RepID=UPI0033CC5986
MKFRRKIAAVTATTVIAGALAIGAAGTASAASGTLAKYKTLQECQEMRAQAAAAYQTLDWWCEAVVPAAWALKWETK